MTATITTPFGAESTAAEVVAGIDLAGRRMIVTGGASGIGIADALQVLEPQPAPPQLLARLSVRGRLHEGMAWIATMTACEALRDALNAARKLPTLAFRLHEAKS